MSWDEAYQQYYSALKSDKVTEQTIRSLYDNLNSDFSNRIVNIKEQLDAQQAAGSKEYYTAGQISVDSATWDMAFRLAEAGLSSVQDIGKRTDYDLLEREVTQYYNKATGEDITNKWNNLSQGSDRTNYNLHFTDDGMVIPYTGRETSSWVQFRDSTLKPIAAIALAAYGVPYVSTALGATTAGASIVAAGGQAALTGVSAGIVSGSASLLAGNDFDDALKSALVSGLSAGATAGFADTIGQTLGFDAGSVASKAAGSAIIAGAKAGITDEDILTSMATAAVTSYLSNKDPVFDATEREGSLAKPGFDDVSMTTDFGVGADYSLSSNLKFPSLEGIKVDQNFDTGANVGESPVDYGLGGSSGLGLATSSSPNLKAMGGGQGLTATRSDNTTLAGKDFTTGLTGKDIKTGIKIAGVLTASDELIDMTIGNKDKQITTQLDRKDKYRNAPIAGFKMVKYDDPATGASKYIPFVDEEALLPPPEGYKRGYAKGGFVSKPTKSKGLAARR